MKALDCCKTMEMELTGWKAMVYDIVRVMDKLPGGEKEKIISNIQDIHILVEEMDDRIDEIREMCTPQTCIDDIKTEREEFDKMAVSFRVKVEDAIDYLGAGNFGG